MKRLLVLLVLVALLVSLSGVLKACSGSDEQVTTGTVASPTQQSETSSMSGGLRTPVSGSPQEGTLFFQPYAPGGDGGIAGTVTYHGTPPRDSVLVTIYDLSGDFHSGTWARDSYAFEHLPPGSYRLAVNSNPTGYISQYYGGLPFQGHRREESPIVEVGDGVTRADFVLEPGRSIAGRVTGRVGRQDHFSVLVYDASGQVVEGTSCSTDSPDFLLIGLVPGKYRVAAAWNTPDGMGAKVFYGGDSLKDADIVDITDSDAGGIDMDLRDMLP